MEALIILIIIILILVYTKFNFKASFTLNNKKVTFSVSDQSTSDQSEI